MTENDINSLDHTTWRCQCHVVFAPKYICIFACTIVHDLTSYDCCVIITKWNVKYLHTLD